MLHLERNGYGSYFNDIYYDSHTLIKKVKNEYGRSKLKNEIQFYEYIKESECLFPAPIIYSYNDSELCMKYYPNHIPLYKIYNDISDNKKSILNKQIQNNLNVLHSSSIKPVSKHTYTNDLILETSTKLLERIVDVIPIIKEYPIVKVNNIILRSFDELLGLIKTKIDYYISLKSEYTYVPIHGDCQFNNILYNIETSDMIFIDPRGYFGSSTVFGIPEYDFAKVMFALTGYDVFDNMEIDSLKIEGTNLILNNIYLEKDVLQVESFTRYLVLSIWLGNAHCFKDTPLKAAYSYYYAMYLGTLVYNDVIFGTK